MRNICNYITKLYKNKSELQYIYETKFNAYKNELNKQNIYTITIFIENISVLHDEVKDAGYSSLLYEIKEFQKIVTQKTNVLLQFHNINCNIR